MERKVANDSYFKIFGWMTGKLGLKGNELMVYALIYSFCENCGGKFDGSQQYISEFVGCSRKVVIECIEKLTSKGYIHVKKRQKTSVYSVNFSVVGCNENSQHNALSSNVSSLCEVTNSHCAKSRNVTLQSHETLHNNIVYNKYINNSLKERGEQAPSPALSLPETQNESVVPYIVGSRNKLEEAISDYKKMRISQGKPLNPTQEKYFRLQLQDMADNDDDRYKILCQSIANGWMKLVPLTKTDRNGSVDDFDSQTTSDMAEIEKMLLNAY